MAFIRFTSDGYICSEVDGYELFCSHCYKELFNFLYCDFSALQENVKEYLKCIINTEDFSVIENPNETAVDFYYSEIVKELNKTHPFFLHIPNYANNIVAEYLNDLLAEPFSMARSISQSFDKKQLNLCKSVIVDKIKYAKIIEAVKLKQSCEDILLQNQFYDYAVTAEKYHAQLMARIEDRVPERYITAVPAAELVFAQDTLNCLFFWVLDLNNVLVDDLNFNRRYMLFEELFGFFLYPLLTSKADRIIGYNPDIDKALIKSDLSISLSFCRPKKCAISEKDRLSFDAIKKEATGKPELLPVTYNINHIIDLLFLESERLVQAGIKIRSCRYCGKYFIIKNLKNYYCDAIKDGETKPCNIVGKTKAFEEHKANNPPLAAYDKYYGTKHSQFSRHIITLEEYDVWLLEATEKRKQTEQGLLSLSDYTNWLILSTRKPKRKK